MRAFQGASQALTLLLQFVAIRSVVEVAAMAYPMNLDKLKSNRSASDKMMA